MNSIEINYSNKQKSLPNKLDFSITLNNKPLSNILLKIEIGTIKKNNYTCLTNLSDINGKITITNNELLEQIESETKFALMDYCGINNNFNGKIKVSIFTTNEIQNALNAYEKYSKYFEYTKNYKENLKKMNKMIETVDINALNIESKVSP